MQICEYGCGREAKYPPRRGMTKWCCETTWQKCPQKIKEKTKPLKIYTEKMCFNGCGNRAKYKYDNGRFYCESHTSKCPVNIERATGFKHSKETIELIREKSKRENLSEETLKRMSISSKLKWTSELKEKASKIAKQRPPEFYKRLAEALTGRPSPFKGVTNRYSKETLKRMSESSKRENLSLETLQRMSISSRESKKDPKVRKKLSESSKKENLSPETRRKMSQSARKRTIKYIQENLKNGYQLTPFYNPYGCKIIDYYSKRYNCNFQHAMNGGEVCIIGYWVDGYDKEKNIVIEIDEAHHYKNGKLTEEDIRRQKEICEFLGCKFIRIRL